MSRAYQKLKYIKSRCVVFEIDFRGLLLLKNFIGIQCFTTLCWVLPYSEVRQLYAYMYLLFLGFLP